MSGIVAVVMHDGLPVDRTFLRRAADFMKFRGPDAQEIWCAEPGAGAVASVGLGHTLLSSSLDCARERQPASLDGQVWIAADVRIDGRRELIQTLGAHGCDVRGDTPDAELILHAYGVWGDECTRHLIGDFAFALWDASRRRLLCARDLFGVVPLYYATVKGGLVCSNTLDCLRQHPDVSDALNDQAIADHLLFGSNQEWQTTNFADIRQVPPAHILMYSSGTLRIERCATLPAPRGAVRRRRPQDYIEQFRELLDQATSDRLRASSAGIMMSGGLDSTTVAAAAKRVLSGRNRAFNLRAYTWVYEHVIPHQERHYAGVAAQALGIPIQFLVADEDPLAAPSATARAQLTPLQMVSSHARVMLSGLGGDSAVYPDFGHWLGLLKGAHLICIAGDIGRHLRAHGQLPPKYLRVNLRRWLGRPVWRPPYPTWLCADFAERLDLKRRLEQVTDERLSDRSRTGMVSPFWANFLSNRDPDHTRVPVKMAHPFFDVRLIDFLMGVPTVPWFVDKYILRAALVGVIPDEVRLRPKTPLASWPQHALVKKHGVPAWRDELAQTPELRPYVDLDALRKTLHSPGDVSDYEYQTAVRATTLAIWLRRNGLTANNTPTATALQESYVANQEPRDAEPKRS